MKTLLTIFTRNNWRSMVWGGSVLCVLAIGVALLAGCAESSGNGGDPALSFAMSIDRAGIAEGGVSAEITVMANKAPGSAVAVAIRMVAPDTSAFISPLAAATPRTDYILQGADGASLCGATGNDCVLMLTEQSATFRVMAIIENPNPTEPTELFQLMLMDGTGYTVNSANATFNGAIGDGEFIQINASDIFEICVLSNPAHDCDGDTIANGVDNCSTVTNQDQKNTDRPASTTDGDALGDACDVDDDNDGLIEINFLEDLNYVRRDLDGSHYNNGVNPASNAGCPAGGCNGYELMRALDFNDAASYANGRINTTWCPSSGGAVPATGGSSCRINGPGFEPIGKSGANNFTAIFEGNGNTIANLFIGVATRSADDGAGLFGHSTGTIRHVGLTAVTVRNNQNNTGGLAGVSSGIISASWVNGSISSDANNVGGLVGSQPSRTTGMIIASWSAGTVEGPGVVGGLLGIQGDAGDRVIASYSRAAITATNDDTGGLIGRLNNGEIHASWAVGRVEGSGINIGGLIGTSTVPDHATGIMNSYWDTSSTGTGRIFGSGGNDCNNDNDLDVAADTICTGTVDETNDLQDSATNAGLTTAQMQNGTLPNFGTCAGAYSLASGRYPRLKRYTGTSPAGETPATDCSNHATYGAVLDGQ